MISINNVWWEIRHILQGRKIIHKKNRKSDYFLEESIRKNNKVENKERKKFADSFFSPQIDKLSHKKTDYALAVRSLITVVAEFRITD